MHSFITFGGSRTFLGPVVGGIVLTALPEALRALAGIEGLPPGVIAFLKDGRLILYGLLLVLATIFMPQGFVTPALFQRRARPPAVAPTPKTEP
jgi:branched-chain amino acid transport system permease protein